MKDEVKDFKIIGIILKFLGDSLNKFLFFQTHALFVWRYYKAEYNNIWFVDLSQNCYKSY